VCLASTLTIRPATALAVARPEVVKQEQEQGQEQVGIVSSVLLHCAPAPVSSSGPPLSLLTYCLNFSAALSHLPFALQMGNVLFILHPSSLILVFGKVILS
jgi:hypothetical protein